MAARLQHEYTPEIVGVPGRPLPLVSQKFPARGGKSVDDQSQRLTADVCIDCFQDNHWSRTLTDRTLETVVVSGFSLTKMESAMPLIEPGKKASAFN